MRSIFGWDSFPIPHAVSHPQMPPVLSHHLGILTFRFSSIRYAVRTQLPSRFLHYTPLLNRLTETKPTSTLVEGATEVSHSHFLSTSGPYSDFNPAQNFTAGLIHTSNPIGKLDPTNNSHLFKLILPLPLSLSKPTERTQTAFLLHPSQPLSHLSRLIVGSLKSKDRNAEIQYLAVTGREQDLEDHLRNAEVDQDANNERDVVEEGEVESRERQEGGPFLNERKKEEGRYQEVSWSQSTDLSDFIKQSCLNEKFKIVISHQEGQTEKSVEGKVGEEQDITIEVQIPSFASRTTYLRERLLKLTKKLDKTTKKKKEIDLQAHKSAQRLGTAALALGVVYWGVVVRLTFFTEAGWNMMEPITWTTGFAALLCGSGFLIYHNREVSYSSLLDLSITARQKSLYDKHELDVEAWTEMVSEAKTLRKEIKRIAADYDIDWQGELENLANVEKYSKRIPNESGSQVAIPANQATSSLNDTEPGETSDEITKSRRKQINDKESVEDEDQDDDEKIDIDKTIDEASEMAEQTKEKGEKAKDAERKGEVMDEREDEKSDLGKKKKEEGESARRGRLRAEGLARKE